MKTNNGNPKVSIPKRTENDQPTEKVSQQTDLFDLTRLRLSQDFVAAAGVKKELTTVPVRKPSREWFIRSHPDPDYRFSTCVVELKEDNEVYLVEPSLWDDLISESTFGPRVFVTTVNRQGVVFLWPIRLPGSDGRLDDWNRSALELSEFATESWVRIQANRSLGAYEMFRASGDWPEPDWKLPPFQELLRLAFKGKFIDTFDHPVLRQLRGEVKMDLGNYSQIWLADFEYSQPPGEHPTPVCLVAREFLSGRLVRLWRDELNRMSEPPYPIDSDTLFVAYYASAELGCHLALDWAMPVNILDLCVEFRCQTSGLHVPCGRGLLGALACYGLDGIESVEKDTMRELAMRGGEYTSEERVSLLDYCQTDVDALARLLPAMMPQIDLPRALLRGRYMAAAAQIEWNGVPIDVDTLAKLRSEWESIQDHLIESIDRDYGIYDGRTFKADRWASWLAQRNIAWPHTASGALALDDDTFRQAAQMHPEISPIRELRSTLSKLRLHDLAVGSDGRNRCMLSAFASRTGRNQPSNSKFIFGPATWLRALIKPPPEMAVAYIDYSQQEFAIGAALSGDRTMMKSYTSGDPYLAFARQAGAVPADATKQSHKVERARFKTCALAVQYGMGAESLAAKLDEPVIRGRELLRLHKETYSTYWQWSDAARDYAMLTGRLHTVFGWMVHVDSNANPRSLRNFPAQANGAEMLRLACCMATEQGIKICAPIHDALLIEAPLVEIDQAIARCQEVMRKASEIVLGGFSLRTDVDVVRYPERYMDERGKRIWEVVCSLI